MSHVYFAYVLYIGATLIALYQGDYVFAAAIACYTVVNFMLRTFLR